MNVTFNPFEIMKENHEKDCEVESKKQAQKFEVKSG